MKKEEKKIKIIEVWKIAPVRNRLLSHPPLGTMKLYQKISEKSSPLIRV